MDPLPVFILSPSLFLFPFNIFHIPHFLMHQLQEGDYRYCAGLCPKYCRRPSGDQLPGDLEVCQNAERVPRRFDLLVHLARQTVAMYRNSCSQL